MTPRRPTGEAWVCSGVRWGLGGTGPRWEGRHGGKGQAEPLVLDKPGSFDSPLALRDVAWLGDCDQGCLALADLLGWKVRSYHPS